MPEEINRVLTDQISDYLFTTERSALDNLVREGISADRIHFVGNVMIDSLSRHRSKAAQQPVLSDLGIVPGEFALVTLHRPSNVDDADAFSGILDALCEISRRIPVLFPVHPRTRNRMVEFGLDRRLNEYGDIRLAEPLGYLDFLQCMANSRFVLTDSGGIQEETTVLGIPCITARENTERPITVTEGTNVVVGRDARKLLEEAHKVLDGGGKQGRVPDLWDGGASVRIVDVLRRELLTAGGGLQ
jgi:UDP-N-acetylglucosamine 2-epimerase (non-hydrolysing)